MEKRNRKSNGDTAPNLGVLARNLGGELDHPGISQRCAIVMTRAENYCSCDSTGVASVNLRIGNLNKPWVLFNLSGMSCTYGLGLQKPTTNLNHDTFSVQNSNKSHVMFNLISMKNRKRLMGVLRRFSRNMEKKKVREAKSFKFPETANVYSKMRRFFEAMPRSV